MFDEDDDMTMITAQIKRDVLLETLMVAIPAAEKARDTCYETAITWLMANRTKGLWKKRPLNREEAEAELDWHTHGYWEWSNARARLARFETIKEAVLSDKLEDLITIHEDDLRLLKKFL